MTELPKDKLQSLIDYSRFILCDECCKDNQNCMVLKYNSSINIYELLNSLIKDFTDVELMLFSKYVLECNHYYSYYLDGIVNKSIEIRKVYGKYISKLDVSTYLAAFYYVFFLKYFVDKAETEEEKEYVRQFFEYNKISKCIKRNGIDEEALEKIYDESIVHFDISPIELNFGFNDIYEKYVKVNTNIDWNVK